MTRNAVLYARKSSTDEERQGATSKSVADQLVDMRRYAQAHGFVVVAEKYDDAISGRGDATRPGFMEMRALIGTGDADTIVLATKSRLFRNSALREVMMQDLDDRGVQVHAVSGGGLIKRDTAHDWFVDGLDGLMDDRLWRERSEGWRRTLARRIENGLPHHGLPRFGYRRVDKRYVPDAETGPVLADLYRRYAAGAGIQVLRRDLNERGILTTKGNPWSVTSLRRALDNGFAAGLIFTDGDTYLPGAHKPVITMEEWQAFLDVRHERKAQPPKRKTPP